MLGILARSAYDATRATFQQVLDCRDPRLLPRIGTPSDLVRELVHRLKAEWPGTRRIAGQLARLGVKASRSGVQRILRRPREPEPADRIILATAFG